ncbi:MAG TPA: hypothetical protein VNT01_09240 [Symbiobacteriaceae bacterium]|nr:hypothetical protein [Symbiobacteriaceae bacterium]
MENQMQIATLEKPGNTVDPMSCGIQLCGLDGCLAVWCPLDICLIDGCIGDVGPCI